MCGSRAYIATCDFREEGGGGSDHLPPTHNPPRKLQVAISFLGNTGTSHSKDNGYEMRDPRVCTIITLNLSSVCQSVFIAFEPSGIFDHISHTYAVQLCLATCKRSSNKKLVRFSIFNFRYSNSEVSSIFNIRFSIFNFRNKFYFRY